MRIQIVITPNGSAICRCGAKGSDFSAGHWAPTLLEYLENTWSSPLYRPGGVREIGRKRGQVFDKTLNDQEPIAAGQYCCLLTVYSTLISKNNTNTAGIPGC